MNLYTSSNPRHGYECLCNTRNVVHDTLTPMEEAWIAEYFGKYEEDRQLALLWLLRDLETGHLYICEAFDTEDDTTAYAYKEVCIC